MYGLLLSMDTTGTTTVKNNKSNCYSNSKESGVWYPWRDLICKPAHWLRSLIHCSLANVFKIMIKQFSTLVFLAFTNTYKSCCDSNSNVPWGRWYSGIHRHNKNIHDLKKQWIKGANRRLAGGYRIKQESLWKNSINESF